MEATVLDYLIIAVIAIILCLCSPMIKKLFGYLFYGTVIVGVVDEINDQDLVYLDLDDRDLISRCWIKMKDVYSNKRIKINIHSDNLLREIKEKKGKIISFSVKKPTFSLWGYDACCLNS